MAYLDIQHEYKISLKFHNHMGNIFRKPQGCKMFGLTLYIAYSVKEWLTA